jgi:hypothetical protein
VVIGDWHGPTTMRCAHLLIVSDETVVVDLNTKSRLYGAAGYPVYWVITREAVFEHTRPDGDGYRSVVRYRPEDRISVPYGDTSVAVADLVGLG